MHGGHLTADNVRLAHRLCNRVDYQWRNKITPMLAQGMSLEGIAERLNAAGVRDVSAGPVGSTGQAAGAVARREVGRHLGG